MARKTNVEINGHKYYKVNPVIGKNPDGTYIRKQFYGVSRQDALKRYEEYKAGLGGLHQDSLGSLGDSIKDWTYNIARLDSAIKPSSYERYEGVYRNYIQGCVLSGKQIKEITSQDVQKYYSKLYAGGVSTSRIYNINKVLRKYFNWCIGHQLIEKNPCSRVTIPGKREYKEEIIEVFSDDEIRRIVRAIDNPTYKLMIVFAFNTGMRLGELLALRYQDVENGVVRVTQSLSEYAVIDADGESKREQGLQSPKSRTSIREIPLPDGIVLPEGNPDDFIFLTSNGKHISKASFRKTWMRILERANVPYRKFHACRHSYITRLIQAGVPIAVVKELAGHSTIEMTMRYTHIDLADKLAAVKKLSLTHY